MLARLTSTLLLLVGLGCAGAPPHPADRCVVDEGCPLARTLSPCSEVPDEILTVEDALARSAELAGRVVALRGSLSRVGGQCTELGCLESACCNACEGQLALATEPTPQLVYPLPPHIRLGHDEEEWRCSGDETGQCCHYAIDGGEALVTGTLEVSGSTVRLRPTSVCTP